MNLFIITGTTKGLDQSLCTNFKNLLKNNLSANVKKFFLLIMHLL